MAPSRREFVKLAAGAGALWALGGCRKSAITEKAIASKGPRYFVQMFLNGGHDSVYTTDPKERSEVQPEVDLPAENRIVAAKKLRLGAHFAPLERWIGDLTVLNGVQVGTANHDTGFKQFTRLKTNASSRMPSALDIIGDHRDTQPLGAVYMNVTHRVLHSPRYMGYADKFYFGSENIFDRVSEADRENLGRLSRLMQAEAESLERAGLSSSSAAVTASNFRQVAALFDRVSALEPYTPPIRTMDYASQVMSEAMDRTLWMLEHDLVRCAVIDLGHLSWDTHIGNAPIQDEMNGYFVTHFDRFMAELRERRNAHGRLADQTVVIAGSDLGRFPILNDMHGKDHLPQTSFFFSGPSFPGGAAFGGTNKLMQGMPLSLQNGKTDKGTHMTILDDIGTTVLHMAGLDPQRYGYTGKVLEFLLDKGA